MKINEILAAADAIEKNAFLPREKAATVCRFEERLRKEFLNEDAALSYPDCEDVEMMLPDRWTEIYVYYLAAMICFWHKDLAEYNSYITLFSAMMEDYRREKAQAGGEVPANFVNLFG